MASSSQLVGGGGRLNIDTDQDGNTLTNMDSSENKKKGRTESIGTTGYLEKYLGKTGEVLLYTGIGVGSAEGVWRKYGPKGNNGLVKPGFKFVANGLATVIGAEKPFPNTPQESVDTTGNKNNGKTTDGTKYEQEKSVHDKSYVKDNNSISKNGDARKFIPDSTGGMKPNPNYTKPKFIQTLERKIV